MRKSLYILLFVIASFAILLTSCDRSSSNTFDDQHAEQFIVNIYPSIRMSDNIDEIISKSDFIISCTVKEVGSAFICNDIELSKDPTPNELHDYVCAIRTPITLEINKVYYDKYGVLKSELVVLENRGQVDNYVLNNPFPEYEIEHEYLLFIAQAPDNSTNIIIHQGSLELLANRFGTENTKDFEAIFNHKLFDGYLTFSEIENDVYMKLAN